MKLPLLRLLFLFAPVFSFAQRLDLGYMACGTHYYGDVVNEVELSTIRYASGGFIRYRLNNFTALKAFGLIGKVSGDDRLSESQWQRNRNWSFETLIMEGSLQLEVNLLEDRNTGRRLMNPLIPYLFAGIGAFYFKPQSEIGQGNRLQSTAPLMLSGVKYQQIAAAIPVGVGFRYYLDKKILVGAEFGLRYTTTSYIDDIGNHDRFTDAASSPFPKAARYYINRSLEENNPGDYRGKMGLGRFNINDLYAIFGVTLAYNFNHSKGTLFWRRYQGCPRFF